MMVGYWEPDSTEIYESFITGKPLKLGEPQHVDGPGCIECGLHWVSVRHEPCAAYEDRPIDATVVVDDEFFGEDDG